jgi:hypothetical protein
MHALHTHTYNTLRCVAEAAGLPSQTAAASCGSCYSVSSLVAVGEWSMPRKVTPWAVWLGRSAPQLQHHCSSQLLAVATGWKCTVQLLQACSRCHDGVPTHLQCAHSLLLHTEVGPMRTKGPILCMRVQWQGSLHVDGPLLPRELLWGCRGMVAGWPAACWRFSATL